MQIRGQSDNFVPLLINPSGLQNYNVDSCAQIKNTVLKHLNHLIIIMPFFKCLSEKR